MCLVNQTNLSRKQKNLISHSAASLIQNTNFWEGELSTDHFLPDHSPVERRWETVNFLPFSAQPVLFFSLRFFTLCWFEGFHIKNHTLRKKATDLVLTKRVSPQYFPLSLYSNPRVESNNYMSQSNIRVQSRYK